MSHLPPPNVFKKNGIWTVDGRPRESLTPLTQATPSNTPGFSLITVLITLPPLAALPPHTHSGAAVTGNIIKGRVLNQMNDEDPRHYGDGEGEERGWYESPGCHHVRNENPSETSDTIFVAVFLVRTEILDKVGMEGLVNLDAAREEQARGVEEEEGNHGVGHEVKGKETNGVVKEEMNGVVKEGQEKGHEANGVVKEGQEKVKGHEQEDDQVLKKEHMKVNGEAR